MQAATAHHDTLSLHDALPILAILLGTPPLTHRSRCRQRRAPGAPPHWRSVRELSILHPIESRLSRVKISIPTLTARACRSEEHTSELQSPTYLVCRLRLEKKK